MVGVLKAWTDNELAPKKELLLQNIYKLMATVRKIEKPEKIGKLDKIGKPDKRVNRF